MILVGPPLSREVYACCTSPASTAGLLTRWPRVNAIDNRYRTGMRGAHDSSDAGPERHDAVDISASCESGVVNRTRGHMQRVNGTVGGFLRDEEGIAVTEYGLLVALVAVLLIGVVTIFGSSIKSWFADRTSTITTV